MRTLRSILFVVAGLVIVPSVVYAQASITGVVKDISGAVLPGVTVEAASPALIEKTRTAATDGTGQYRIIDLAPGIYSVTFTLTGFNTVKREGIELMGSFVASVNVELKVGAVEESVTVTAETPLVDTQRTTQERSIAHDVIDTVPSGRLPTELAVLIPGVVTTGSVAFNGMGAQDVGGSGGDQVVTLGVHGSPSSASKVTQNGVALNTNLGNWDFITPNVGAAQEVTVETSGTSAEFTEGGVRMNLIPREGGNTFRGTFFGGFSNNGMAANNLTPDLQARGLTAINSVKKVVDANPGVGGPLVQDRLWFYGSYHLNVADTWASGTGYDPNWNSPNSFVNPFSHVASLAPVSNDGLWKEGQVRVTGQVTPKNKVAFSWTKEAQCKCPSYNSAIGSPGINNRWGTSAATVDWTAPVTSRLLFEAHMFYQRPQWGWYPLDGTNPNIVIAQDQSNGTLYHGGWLSDFDSHTGYDLRYRVSMSYVTGAHAFKVGFNNGRAHWDTSFTSAGANEPVSYRFNNGIPNQLTEYALPYHQLWDLNSDGGAFAQDRWTLHRLTVNAGVRWDHYKSTNDGQTVGPVPLVPNRNVTLFDTTDLAWNDVTPRLGVALDLFGDGKTALKASVSKYVAGQTGPFAPPIGQNGAGTLVNIASRSWTDSNGNFFPDCNLLNTALNGECGPLSPSNFGSTTPGKIYAPDVRSGWGSRGYDWEFSTGVQRQILPRVSAEVSYFRRIFGNFLVTDNLAVPASGYNSFSITAPTNPLLPGGGGYTVGGLYNVNPSYFSSPANNLIELSNAVGSQIQHWNGIDITSNARLGGGFTVQGGVSMGRTTTDNCAILSQLPGLGGSTPAIYCHVDTPFLAQVKLLESYTVPRVNVLVSAAFQSIPGPAEQATYTATNAVVQPSLGRPLSGNAANVSVNLIDPNVVYGDRLNQLDLRLGKILKYGRTRSTVSLDVYNLMNSSAVLQQSSAYGNFLQPQVLVVGRFAKISLQFDF
jgi:hypothetical protein